MTIQEAVEKTGLSAHTLRYYERVRLIPPVGRAANGHRQYNQSDLGWIDFVKCLRNTGMPIIKARRYMRLALKGDQTAADRMDLLVQHRVQVKRRIQEWRRHLAALDTKIAFYESIRPQPKVAAAR
jgi:DNA-binding transcriptional MerR regulator